MKMLSDKEKVELFFKGNKFDPKLIPNYIKFVLETFDSFKIYSDAVKISNVYKRAIKYNWEAIKYSKEYRKMYTDAVNVYGHIKLRM